MYTLIAEQKFGPPSEPIDVSQFIQEGQETLLDSSPPQSAAPTIGKVQSAKEILASLSHEERLILDTDCSVDDIRHLVTSTWDQPRVSAYLHREQDRALLRLSNAEKSGSSSKGKKAPPETPMNINEDAPEVVQIKNIMSQCALKCMNFEPGTQLFVRNTTFCDTNAVSVPKATRSDPASVASSSSTALLTISTFNKLPSGHFSPNSQHVFLHGQTLGDVFEAIPCSSNELPEEILDNDGKLVGYTTGGEARETSGCAIAVEGLIYGDGMSEQDYADQVLEHLAKASKNKDSNHMQWKKSETGMYDTPLSSLTLRIDQPYWLLHQGNCEHWLVVDEIRMLHPTDPKGGYPIMLYSAPLMMDLCRVCAKKIAEWSILGDVRLRESPCVICGPCWRIMGNGEEGTIVVPLPKHEMGW